jgi:hypothetical protein
MRQLVGLGALAALAVSVLGVGCGHDTLAIDPAGSTRYVINNQTALTLKVTMKLVPQLGSGQAQYPEPIPAGGRLQFFQDVIIGVNPLPSSTFTGIELHDATTGALRYSQEPIQSALWASHLLSGDADGFHTAEHTLTVTDEMLVR